MSGVHSIRLSAKTLSALTGEYVDRIDAIRSNADVFRMDDETSLDIVRPTWRRKSDILWITPSTSTGLDFFQKCFDRLNVAKKLAFLGDVVMFSGFFIRRRVTKKPAWHVDFERTGLGAFTLMAPLQDMPGDCCHLLYKEGEKTVQKRYRLGSALVFGDGLVHSTEPGNMPSSVQFLCFTLGRRDMTPSEWRNARDYIRSQTRIYKTPSQTVVRVSD